MTNKLFTYGLLQVPRIQQQLFKRAIHTESFELQGYKISDKLVNGLYKTIKPSCASCESTVEGTILHLEEEDLVKTDKFEGVQSGMYKRIQVADGIEAYIVGADFE